MESLESNKKFAPVVYTRNPELIRQTMDLGIKLIKFRPWGGKSQITAVPYARALLARAVSLFSWNALIAALLGIMLARWAWLLFAPADAVMPPAAWEASDDAGRVFGTATESAAVATVALGNIKLIGVFANQTKGFAIMQVDGKQLGVAQGEDIKPGVRLVETHPDHVVLSQGGVESRVVLTGAPAIPSPAMPAPAALPRSIQPPGGPAGPGVIQPRAVEHMRSKRAVHQ